MPEIAARPRSLSPRTPSRASAAGGPLLRLLLSELGAHDPYTYRHSVRTVRLSLLLGRECGITSGQLRTLCLGALVHDVGKVLVPGAVLHKPGRLTKEEWEAVRRHPEEGERLLRHVCPSEAAARVVAQHHERWDGRGYPAGLRGEEIDRNARIVAVADAYDAMTSARAYRRAMSREEATEELARCGGTQFDPRVTEAFCRLPRALLERAAGRGAAPNSFAERTAGR